MSRRLSRVLPPLSDGFTHRRNEDLRNDGGGCRIYCELVQDLGCIASIVQEASCQMLSKLQAIENKEVPKPNIELQMHNNRQMTVICRKSCFRESWTRQEDIVVMIGKFLKPCHNCTHCLCWMPSRTNTDSDELS